MLSPVLFIVPSYASQRSTDEQGAHTQLYSARNGPKALLFWLRLDRVEGRHALPDVRTGVEPVISIDMQD